MSLQPYLKRVVVRDAAEIAAHAEAYSIKDFERSDNLHPLDGPWRGGIPFVSGRIEALLFSIASSLRRCDRTWGCRPVFRGRDNITAIEVYVGRKNAAIPVLITDEYCVIDGGSPLSFLGPKSGGKVLTAICEAVAICAKALEDLDRV